MDFMVLVSISETGCKFLALVNLCGQLRICEHKTVSLGCTYIASISLSSNFRDTFGIIISTKYFIKNNKKMSQIFPWP